MAWVLVLLVTCIAAMVWVAVGRYPAFLVQPGAHAYLRNLFCILLVYLALIFTLAKVWRASWDRILRIAVTFGLLAAIVELIGIGIENGIFFAVRGPFLQIGFMVLTLTLWAVAGFRGARAAGLFRAGLASAVGCAMVCMLVAVAGGFLLELFLFPPQTKGVSTWPEFRRSGWTDARAFALANTLDSGFTHLTAAPVVGAMVGSIGSGLARAISTER